MRVIHHTLVTYILEESGESRDDCPEDEHDEVDGEEPNDKETRDKYEKAQKNGQDCCDKVHVRESFQ